MSGMHTHFPVIGAGWTVGGLSAITAAIALLIMLCAAGCRGPAERRSRFALGTLAIIAAALSGVLSAERVSADLVDLSESAARQLTRDLRVLVAVVGGMALLVGLITPVLAGGRWVAKGRTLALTGALVLGITGVLASVLILRGIGSNAGMDPRLCIVSILLALALAWPRGSRSAPAMSGWLAKTGVLFVAAAVLIVLTNVPAVITGVAISLGAITLAGCALIAASVNHPPEDVADARAASGHTSPLHIAGAAALLTLLPATVQLGHFGLERHARAWVASSAPATPPDAPVFAVCIRPETFAVIVPAMGKEGQDLIRAAVLADRSQFESPTDLEHLEVGTVIPAMPIGGDLDSKRFQLKARVAHGDHYHDYDFAVVNSAKAEPRELAAAMHAHAASPLLLGGIVLGVVSAVSLMRHRVTASSILIVLVALALAVIGGPGTSVGIVLGVIPLLLLNPIVGDRS